MLEQRRRIRDAFGAAAPDYDKHAAVQRAIVGDLLAWTRPPGNMNAPLLDAGCGTGFASEALRQRAAHVIGIDLAPAMATLAAQRGESGIAADLEHLPLRNASIACYWSSLAWQWCKAQDAAREAARVLMPGGRLQVATLGPDTLAELRACFAGLDQAEHVRQFESPAAIDAALRTAGFVDIRHTRHTRSGYAPDLASLLRDIRGVGAHTLGESRRRGMLGRHAWQRLCAAYEVHREPSGLPARYDVLLFEAIR
ncbi:methyltransferase domain-containing protein [Niveibacterium sp. 24ML]|uniref:methyltransferase domain-containing protein n=1 Tax=Niveibacterium sp. 24ML TaxID=2985512 RepID=UPI00226F0BB4|nr:methyltransferase domain-containing protein [Niveibacterium sp. 24ML]MCX9155112.1 methyltransferase domain-containing protein [Niveibacterium sp. 24ML]